MKIHEFQAKDLFRTVGIPVPPGTVATSPRQAVDGVKGLPGPPWVVKVQIHVGRQMGHAGAIISGGKGKAEDKINALRSHGITVALNLGQLGKTALEVF